MGGGTEAFPDLGQHCEHEDCNQLDFLPFECDGCQKVFCLDHRTQKSHNCPRADHTSRRVVVCELCSMSMEKASGEEEGDILQRHERSGDCDPAKKRKPKCPVSRCRGLLTFSNSNTCKLCHLSVCLKHRFPSEHDCKAAAAAVKGSKYWAYLPPRNCGDKKQRMPSPPSIKTY